ncbi:MAG: hypothetical protein ACHRHE_18105 [Tepidisphaerales bacterium]
MNTRWMTGVIACMALLAGCAPEPRGEAILRYESGRTPFIMLAPYDGEYWLYGKRDEKPRAKFLLNKGDKIGFKVNTPGKVAAVAGKEQVEVEEQDMVWRRK